MNIEKIELFAQKYDMLPGGARVLCAVSGGADSVALLHILWNMEGVDVVAAHFNHCLRAEESDRDEAFVKAMCAEFGIKCLAGRGDVAAFADEKGMSLEEAAREMRYAFLVDAADSEGCSRIATAHNADDNAETLLLNISRGTGLKGLCGIPPTRGMIVRPLLQTTRAEIDGYLTLHGLEHVEDSSNALDDFSRNRIRHHVMPVLRELNPAMAEAVARMTEGLREDEEFISEAAAEFIRENAEGNSIAVGKTMALPAAVRMRVFRRMHGGELSAVHCRAIENICLVRSAHAHADVPGMRVSREYDRLVFGAEEIRSMAERELRIGERIYLPEADVFVSCEFVPECTEIHKSLNTFFFKSENICGRISVGSRKEGDKLALQGRNCTKSLKKLFSEAKLSLAERAVRPVFRDENGIIAVGGFGIAQGREAHNGDDCIIIKIETKEKRAQL